MHRIVRAQFNHTPFRLHLPKPLHICEVILYTVHLVCPDRPGRVHDQRPKSKSSVLQKLLIDRVLSGRTLPHDIKYFSHFVNSLFKIFALTIQSPESSPRYNQPFPEAAVQVPCTLQAAPEAVWECVPPAQEMECRADRGKQILRKQGRRSPQDGPHTFRHPPPARCSVLLRRHPP